MAALPDLASSARSRIGLIGTRRSADVTNRITQLQTEALIVATLAELVDQLEIGGFRDRHGHAAAKLAPLRDARRLLDKLGIDPAETRRAPPV